jgi:hypothetical protein
MGKKDDLEKIEDDNAKTVYKSIIDGFADDDFCNVSDTLILENKIFSKSKGNEKYNEFVSQLDNEQRILLAEMMRLERQSVIHDVLAEITWHIDCNDESPPKNRLITTG